MTLLISNYLCKGHKSRQHNRRRNEKVIMSKTDTQPPSLGVIGEVDAVGQKVTVLKAAQ